MLNDAHIHVGQFHDYYTTPEQLLTLMDETGVDKFAVSSSTTTDEDYDKVLGELKDLVDLAGERVFPVLWLTPLMIAKDAVQKFLDSGIRWSCVKIHPYFHHYWTEEAENMDDAIEIAKSLQVPLLIHSGGDDFCKPLRYEAPISSHPQQLFIIAHSRPIDQTIALMKKYSNVLCDTAFTPVEDVVQLVNEGFSDRVLWGTDIPIHRHYIKDVNMPNYCKSIANDLQKQISEEDYLKITQKNFDKIFLPKR